MNELTTLEKRVFNNVSKLINPNVKLGDKLAEIIGFLAETGTPTNAVSAAEVLSVAGVVLHGETVTFDNPAKPGIDIYEFLADDAQKVTLPGSIAVNIGQAKPRYAVKSTGTLTMDTQPIAGDKVTIGEKVFTFVPVGTDTADGEVSIGADLAGAQAALVAAINGTDGVNNPHPLVSAGEFANDDAVITALIGGVAGDAIATTETFTAATNVFAAATLGSGFDCYADAAITELVAAITAHDTQGIGAVDGTGDTVALTADAGGAAGNNIAIGTTMANGSFTDDATKMSGGVDGTPTNGIKVMVDDTYLYICLAKNDVGGKNWRRITLGSAY